MALKASIHQLPGLALADLRTARTEHRRLVAFDFQATVCAAVQTLAVVVDLTTDDATMAHPAHMVLNPPVLVPAGHANSSIWGSGDLGESMPNVTCFGSSRSAPITSSRDEAASSRVFVFTWLPAMYRSEIR